MPTFGRPRIATRIASSPTMPSSRPGSRATTSSSRSPVPWPWSAESGTGSPSPSRWNSTASRSRRGIVDLVREHDHRLARGAQDRRELLVARRDPGPRVDDEEDEVGLVDRRLRLLGDLRARTARCRPRRRRRCRRAGSVTPFQSARSSLRSRVTPGVSCTTAARVWVSRLTSVDLPTFGKPTIATVPALLTGVGGLVGHGRDARRDGVARAAEPRGRRRASRQSRRISACEQRRRLLVAAPALREPVERHRLAPGDRHRLEVAGAASTPACRGSRPGRSARPPGARPSRRPAATWPGTPERWRVPSTKSPSACPSATIAPHRAHRLAVGLAAAHREAAEGADERAEPGHAVRLDLRHVVDGRAGSRRRAPAGRASEKWLDATTTPPSSGTRSRP